ncbi:MAG: hypothetical protein AAGL29_11885, partial [Bacteroidota bacterium]
IFLLEKYFRQQEILELLGRKQMLSLSLQRKVLNLQNSLDQYRQFPSQQIDKLFSACVGDDLEKPTYNEPVHRQLVEETKSIIHHLNNINDFRRIVNDSLIRTHVLEDEVAEFKRVFDLFSSYRSRNGFLKKDAIYFMHYLWFDEEYEHNRFFRFYIKGNQMKPFHVRRFLEQLIYGRENILQQSYKDYFPDLARDKNHIYQIFK